jgi:hypothetical protein
LWSKRVVARGWLLSVPTASGIVLALIHFGMGLAKVAAIVVPVID